MIGTELRKLRKSNGLLLRQVAAVMELDTAAISKIECEYKKLRKEQLIKFAEIYNVDIDSLVSIWLADSIVEILNSEKTIANKTLKLVKQRINDENRN